MTFDLPDDDDQLMAELREVIGRCDPVPSAVLAAANEAFVWRTIDSDLAELAFDSLLELSSGGVRGTADRQLTFESPGLTIEVDMLDGGSQLIGQLVPAQPGAVEVQASGRTTTVTTDAEGHFTAPAGAGPFRMRVDAGFGPAIVTEWITL